MGKRGTARDLVLRQRLSFGFCAARSAAVCVPGSRRSSGYASIRRLDTDQPDTRIDP